MRHPARDARLAVDLNSNTGGDMSAHLRNFWITTKNDSSATIHATGPKGKYEGFRTTINVNELGESKTAVEIDGFANPDGTLTINIRVAGQPDMSVRYQK